MTIYAIIFYLLAAITVAATALAVTRSNLVHAVVYLVVSFFSTAALFFLLGAPFLAVLEVIIYAGAIMVLFLFIIMMLRLESAEKPAWTYLRQWLPAAVLAALSLAGLAVLVLARGSLPLQAATASPGEFGRYVFQRYWFSVEVASYLLFVALVGALYLGRKETTGPPASRKEGGA